MSAQAEAGNVKIVRGLWNDEFLRSLENFPASSSLLKYHIRLFE